MISSYQACVSCVVVCVQWANPWSSAPCAQAWQTQVVERLGPLVDRAAIPIASSLAAVQTRVAAGSAPRLDEAASGDGLALFWSLFGSVGLPLLTVALLLHLSRRPGAEGDGLGGPGGPSGGSPAAFGKTRARFQMEPRTGVGFGDVAGVDEARRDFEEVVDFLRSPGRYTALGARIPKGVLLAGPPGTGKTLLARAIAGEAGVPFFSISGSEFVEMFVGVGAARVRDLFRRAKEAAPCIVFIDEIDAVGRQRGAGLGGGNDEREQTLNQLLTEMDGFEGNAGVIVLAATNRADVLDPALLRPGRFDRQVQVALPDGRGRAAVLRVHARGKSLDPRVDLDELALRTPGFAGADLANLLNEAVILAGRRNLPAATPREVDDALDRVVAGLEGAPLLDGRAKLLVAYHEAGHALCATLAPGHDAVQKLTLVPRGRARGLTWFLPAEDQTSLTRRQMFARLVGALGGRAAEEAVWGAAEVTTGAASDLQEASRLARAMVTKYGFSEVGPYALADPGARSGDVVMRLLSRRWVSEALQRRVDAAVARITAEAYALALDLVRRHRPALDRAVQLLMERETLSGDEFRRLLCAEEGVESGVTAAVPALGGAVAATPATLVSASNTQPL